MPPQEKISVQGLYPIVHKLLRAWGWVKKFSSIVRVGIHSGQKQETQKLLEEEDEEDCGGEQWEAGLHPQPGSVSCWPQPTVEITEPPEEEEEEEEDAHWYDEDTDGIHDMMVSGEGQGWTAQNTACTAR